MVVDPSAGVVSTGGGGVMVKSFSSESAEVPPAVVWVAVAACGPTGSGLAAVGVRVKVPTGTSVAMVVPSTVMVTVDAGGIHCQSRH